MRDFALGFIIGMIGVSFILGRQPDLNPTIVETYMNQCREEVKRDYSPDFGYDANAVAEYMHFCMLIKLGD